MTGDRAMALDAGAVLVVSAGICAAARHIVFMTVLVVAVLAIRTALRRDLALLAMCTVAGALNDYRSVVRYHIYDYYLPGAIPLWMLLYWGLILRFVLTLFGWPRLALVRTRRSAALLVFELALVIATRQAIYRFYLDPWLSWLPFALALIVAGAVLRPGRRELAVLALFAAGGTAVESAYIRIGGLHRYHLGWIGGVPLWIALWWPLAALVWRDVVQSAESLATGWASAGTSNSSST